MKNTEQSNVARKYSDGVNLLPPSLNKIENLFCGGITRPVNNTFKTDYKNGTMAFFLIRTLRNTKELSRSTKVLQDEGQKKSLSFCSSSTSNLISFLFFKLFARPNAFARAAALSSIIILGACNHVQPEKYKVEAEFSKVQAKGGTNSARLLHGEVGNQSHKVNHKGGKIAEQLTVLSKKNVIFREPFRLSFIGVDSDIVLRRISEFTNIQYFANDEVLFGPPITIDMSLTKSSEVYSLVEAIAKTNGATVKWEGSKAFFTKSVEGVPGPIDGYLIRQDTLNENLRIMLQNRFNLTCATEAKMTVCTGLNRSLTSATKFLDALDGRRGKILWEVIQTDFDVPQIVQTLGLEQQIIVMNLEKTQWLIASTDGRFLDTLTDLTSTVKKSHCDHYILEPQNIEASQLLGPITSLFPELCASPQVLNGQLVYGATLKQKTEVEAIAYKLDANAPQAKIIFLVVTETDVKRVGLSIDWDGTFSTTGKLSNSQLIASLALENGWRVLEMVTDGQSQSAIQQTDRVQGNLVVTDGGSQVTGIETRTVGLSLQTDGFVTRRGFVGNISLTDSSLDGDKTLSASCSSMINIQLDDVVKVCSYSRNSSGLSVRILSGDKSQNEERFTVYAALMSHSTANLDSLRVIAGGQDIVYP